MIDKKDKKKIEKVLKEFFKKITFEVDFELKHAEDSSARASHGNNLKLELKTPHPQVLIGPHGATLHALQLVLGKIVRKQLDPHTKRGQGAEGAKIGKDSPRSGVGVYLDVDINQYKQNKIKYLGEMAQGTADRVALNKKEETLPIMSAYERRIIHISLADRTDITTESQGQGPERRVAIKPA